MSKSSKSSKVAGESTYAGHLKSGLPYRPKVALETVSFIDAFGRRNLSVDEIAFISDILDAAWTNPDPEVQAHIGNLIRKVPSQVTLAPSLSLRAAEAVTKPLTSYYDHPSKGEKS